MKLKDIEHSLISFKRAASFSGRAKADLLIIPVWERKKKGEFAVDIGKLSQELQPAIKAGDFSGKLGENLLLFPKGQKEPRILLCGMGDRDCVTVETIRRSYGNALRKCAHLEVSALNVLPAETKNLKKSQVLLGLVEGLLLAHYQFPKYCSKKDQSQKIKSAVLIGIGQEDLKQIEHIRNVIKGVYLARDFVNGNADEIHPAFLVDAARALDNQYKSIRTKIINKKQCEKEGLGLLLTVSRGSLHDPALIISKYEGNRKSKEHIVVIGKGVTYDTGGLNLKSNMLTMKCDMGGAASCLGLLAAAASTKLPLNFTVVIPAVENAVGAGSYKPGDVYTSYLGKTVEIGNTDAEGRLILADALAYACKKLKPSSIIDFATLTGAMVIALGSEVTGMMSNNEELARDLINAGEESFERVWRLPLIEEYAEKMKSDIADLKNVSGREAASIKAALFLREFITDIPWAHLDIAGSAFLSEGRDYLQKYATGVGVRLMMQYFENKLKD